MVEEKPIAEVERQLVAKTNEKPVSGKITKKKDSNTGIAKAQVQTPAPVQSKEEIGHLASKQPAPELRDSRAKGKPAPERKRLSADAMVPAMSESRVTPGIMPAPVPRLPAEPTDREQYAHYEDNPVQRVAEKPVSTFSIDVDTGSYTNARRMLKEGRLPVRDAVRAEEFINYFSYDYPVPENVRQPFNVITELGPTPWNADTYLLHIGIKGYEMPRHKLPPANLVFLVDVSGSMRSADKLGLLVNSLKLLSNQLRAEDKISLVVYAGASGVVLQPTSGADKLQISRALDGLRAGGSTNGAAGIRLAYQMAQQGFVKQGINRVILATDGDFNVGTVNFQALKDMVAEKRKTGVFLTTLGFGRGNYNDRLMEQLADAGNGNYAYIDSLMEAQKVLVNEMGATLNTIAKDVKIQIEFNPQQVAEYRLVGYENRKLRREDFNNDKVDAGDIGAGHTVTAIYEIALTDRAQGSLIDPLRYGQRQQQPATKVAAEKAPADKHGELAYLRLRFKQPDAHSSSLLQRAINRDSLTDKLDKTSQRFRFSAGVAAFAQLLKGGKYTGRFSYEDVMQLARGARGEDAFGYRGEFLRLVNLASGLDANNIGKVNGHKKDAALGKRHLVKAR